MGKRKDDQEAKEIMEAQAKAAAELKKERDSNHHPKTYKDQRGRLRLRRLP